MFAYAEVNLDNHPKTHGAPILPSYVKQVDENPKQGIPL